MSKVNSQIFYFLLMASLSLIQGCGFHLRGTYSIPACLQELQLEPSQSMDPFHTLLKRVLISNEIQLIQANPLEKTDSNLHNTSILRILHQDFQEQSLAYGLDGQLNRVRLCLRIQYQIDTKIPLKTIQGQVQVSRELTLDSNNVLNTDQERQRLQNDLYSEAATQLVFQLSINPDLNTKAF